MRWQLVVLCVACGAAPRVSEGRTMPEDVGTRNAALMEVGQRMFHALRGGHPEQLLYADDALSVLLDEQAATRVRARRVTVSSRLGVTAARFRPFEGTQYAGLCVQGARRAEPGDPMGVRASSWVFRRALVVAVQPGGRRVASWVEGTFVFSNLGFAAVDLRRAEPPRWEHSALEVETCDIRVGDY